MAGSAGFVIVAWQLRHAVRPTWLDGCGLAPAPNDALGSGKWQSPIQSSTSDVSTGLEGEIVAVGAAAAVGEGVFDKDDGGGETFVVGNG